MSRRSAGRDAHSIIMKKLNVLYLAPTLIPGNPWGRDVIEVIKPPHELRLYSRDQPLRPQIEWAEVVVDFGGESPPVLCREDLLKSKIAAGIIRDCRDARKLARDKS